MSSAKQLSEKRLALDTSGETIHCALQIAGEIFTKSATRRESRQRNVAVLTEELLKERALTVSELSGVIVSLGPGSFTGLRVGLSFAKGIVAAQDIPLIGVTRFEQALFQIEHSRGDNAESVRPDYLFVRVKGDEFYRYRVSDPGCGAIDVVKTAGIAESLKSELACFIDCVVDDLRGDLQEGLQGTQTVMLSIDTLFGAAEEKTQRGERTGWTEIEPLYVLRSAAEIKGPKTGETRFASAGSRQSDANSKNA